MIIDELKPREASASLTGEAVPRQEAAHFERADRAMRSVNNVLLKQYLHRLTEMTPVACDTRDTDADTALFRIERMSYDVKEPAADKLVSALGAMATVPCSLMLIMDGDLRGTDFYIGVRRQSSAMSMATLSALLRDALQGQFPGIRLSEELSVPTAPGKPSAKNALLERARSASAVSACAVIPSTKHKEGEQSHENFVQGLEKFALAMRGRRYTAILIADNMDASVIAGLRRGYECLYTVLSAVSTQQLAYGSSESLSLSETRSRTDTYGTNRSTSSQHTYSESRNYSHSEGSSSSRSEGKNSPNWLGAALSAAATAAGAYFGGIEGAMVGGMVGSAVGGLFGSETSSATDGANSSDSSGRGTTRSDGTTDTYGYSSGKNFGHTEGRTAQTGTNRGLTLTRHDKHVEELLARIDRELKRINRAEGTGLWNAGAYFLAPDGDPGNAQSAAALFRGIMQGEESGLEASAVNTWYLSSQPRQARAIVREVTALRQPLFAAPGAAPDAPMFQSASMLTGSEMALFMGLPRRSVPGLPVVEHVSLAQEVVRLSQSAGMQQDGAHAFTLGCIFDQGKRCPEVPVDLDARSLCAHTLVTGSTGSGKSETVYRLISEAGQAGARCLVVEPAKGEYKDVFGARPDWSVYGTNPPLTPLLRINPFAFPRGVHVLEHVDRLTEIFCACWPMYAAMPAVLKKATLAAYEDVGWDLDSSVNTIEAGRFPCVADLLAQLRRAVRDSEFSDEVKGNYAGALVARVESLANGLNRRIFTLHGLGDGELFDANVIIDLSRIGSIETKALIMGLLVMRLSEYRMSQSQGANAPLRHLTVLEEAHCLLRCPQGPSGAEGADIAAKSVEMLAASIAEMRTYGEGFVIVDQSPTALDPAALRNTNTKITHRLPSRSDRLEAALASAMTEEQGAELAKLPTGVAAVYQNDWEAPVLCSVTPIAAQRAPYAYTKPNLPDS